MKRITILLLFPLLVASACKDRQKTEDSTSKNVDTIPMLVTQVQQCSRLYTTEYHIHKIITHNDKMKVSGSFMKHEFSVNLPLGDRRIAIPMDATLKAYIDMSDFSDKNIKRTGKQLVALTRQNFTDAELTGYEAQGRRQIIDAIPQMGIIEQAQASAARQLVPVFTSMGYKESDITISFRKKFTLSDLQEMIKANRKD